MITRYATPSRRDGVAPRIAIPSRTNTVDAAVQLPSALLKLSLHPDVHLFKNAV